MRASDVWSAATFGRVISNLNLAVVAVDRQLQVRLFTSAAQRLTNLIPADIGRPIAERRWNVEVAGLEALVRDSVQRARTTILDVRDRAGSWHTLSIRPYRTAAGRVDGALLSLSDAHALPPAPLGAGAAAEHELEQQMALVEALAESSSVRDGASVLIESLCRSNGWSGGELWTLDPSTNELRPAGVWQRPGSALLSTHALGALSGAQGAVLARTAVSRGKTAWILRRPRINRAKRADRTTPWQSALAVPIRRGALALGALLLLDHKPRSRDNAFAASLERLGRHVGVWIEGKLVEDALRSREEGYQRLSGRLLHLQDEERRRIAHDLHDSMAQRLALLTMNLDALSKWIDGGVPRVRQTVAESLAIANECVREIRTLTHLLHPPLLDYKGLAAAIRWYVAGFSRRTGVHVDLDVSDLGRLPGRIEQALYRIVQESLTNIHRHASARRASITAARRAGAITLVVRDDGRGFRADSSAAELATGNGDGVGIHSMRERIRELGGEFAIASGPTGTTVRVRTPVTDVRTPVTEEPRVPVANSDRRRS